MTIDTGRAPSGQALAVPATPANAVDGPPGFDPSRWRECPFDGRLARTPYLVLPKLAIQVMPMEWRDRLEAMLVEMEDRGIETPVYEVVPRGGEIRQRKCRDKDDWRYGDIVPEPSIDDPWADYRRNQIAKVKALCPRFAIAIEAAAAGETPKSGSTEGESAGPQDIAQGPSQ